MRAANGLPCACPHIFGPQRQADAHVVIGPADPPSRCASAAWRPRASSVLRLDAPGLPNPRRLSHPWASPRPLVPVLFAGPGDRMPAGGAMAPRAAPEGGCRCLHRPSRATARHGPTARVSPHGTSPRRHQRGRPGSCGFWPRRPARHSWVDFVPAATSVQPSFTPHRPRDRPVPPKDHCIRRSRSRLPRSLPRRDRARTRWRVPERRPKRGPAHFSPSPSARIAPRA